MVVPQGYLMFKKSVLLTCCLFAAMNANASTIGFVLGQDNFDRGLANSVADGLTYGVTFDLELTDSFSLVGNLRQGDLSYPASNVDFSTHDFAIKYTHTVNEQWDVAMAVGVNDATGKYAVGLPDRVDIEGNFIELQATYFFADGTELTIIPGEEFGVELMIPFSFDNSLSIRAQEDRHANSEVYYSIAYNFDF